MRTYHLPAQSRYEDFLWTYKLNDITAWTADHEVVVSISTEGSRWYDYGLVREDPDVLLSSADGTNRVALSGAGVISINVPGATMEQLGPGTATVSVQYRNNALVSRRTIAMARVALLETGGV